MVGRWLPMSDDGESASRQRIIDAIPDLPSDGKGWNPYALKTLAEKTTPEPAYFIAVGVRRAACIKH